MNNEYANGPKDINKSDANGPKKRKCDNLFNTKQVNNLYD